MSGDSTKLPPSIRDVVLWGVTLVVAILVGSFFAYFGWRSLEADLPPAFPVMAAGALVFGAGMAWTAVVRMRLSWQPSIPRAHEGVLEVRLPAQLCRSLRFAGIGGAIFTVGALMGIWLVLTDEPVTWFRAGGALLLVLMLLFVVAFFIAAFLSNRIRFVADGWGLRWAGPLPVASVLVAWTDIAHLSRSEKGMLAPRLVAVTTKGRTLAIPITAVSLPGSREARAALLTEVERLRPIQEPDRPRVDNQDVFERFNDEARRVMIVAQQIARGVGHDEIGTVELLVALAGDDYLSGRALARLGSSAQAVSAAADRAVEPGSAAHLTIGPSRTTRRRPSSPPARKPAD